MEQFRVDKAVKFPKGKAKSSIVSIDATATTNRIVKGLPFRTLDGRQAHTALAVLRETYLLEKLKGRCEYLRSSFVRPRVMIPQSCKWNA